MPQTPEPISAASGRTLLQQHFWVCRRYINLLLG